MIICLLFHELNQTNLKFSFITLTSSDSSPILNVHDFNACDSNSMIGTFEAIMLGAFDLIPRLSVTLSNRSNPWLTPELKVQFKDK